MTRDKTEQTWFKGSACTEYTFAMSRREWLSVEQP